MVKLGNEWLFKGNTVRFPAHNRHSLSDLCGQLRGWGFPAQNMRNIYISPTSTWKRGNQGYPLPWPLSHMPPLYSDDYGDVLADLEVSEWHLLCIWSLAPEWKVDCMGLGEGRNRRERLPAWGSCWSPGGFRVCKNTFRFLNGNR